MFIIMILIIFKKLFKNVNVGELVLSFWKWLNNGILWWMRILYVVLIFVFLDSFLNVVEIMMMSICVDCDDDWDLYL